VLLEGDIATVGISKFAVDQLTDLIVIDLPKVGAQVAAGKPFGEIESVKAVSDLYSPIGGEVIEVNTDVASNVQLLADDP
jgi:glycine cleavage system H protein